MIALRLESPHRRTLAFLAHNRFGGRADDHAHPLNERLAFRVLLLRKIVEIANLILHHLHLLGLPNNIILQLRPDFGSLGFALIKALLEGGLAGLPLNSQDLVIMQVDLFEQHIVVLFHLND